MNLHEVHDAGLLREHHDEVARFMAAMQPEGAAQASQLSGLSLQAGLALAMQRRQFAECAGQLSALHDDSSSLVQAITAFCVDSRRHDAC